MLLEHLAEPAQCLLSQLFVLEWRSKSNISTQRHTAQVNQPLLLMKPLFCSPSFSFIENEGWVTFAILLCWLIDSLAFVFPNLQTFVHNNGYIGAFAYYVETPSSNSSRQEDRLALHLRSLRQMCQQLDRAMPARCRPTMPPSCA